MKKGIAVVLMAVFLLLAGCGMFASGTSSLDGHAVNVDLINWVGTGTEASGTEERPTNYYKALVDETSYTFYTVSEGVRKDGAYTITVSDESELNMTDGYHSDSMVWAIKADFTGLADEKEDIAITEFINGAIDELAAQRTEFEAYLKTLDAASIAAGGSPYILHQSHKGGYYAQEYTWYSAIQIETLCYNGYLSVAVYLGYTGPVESGIYDCRTIILDLYTGKQVNFADLFADGFDIADQLELTAEQVSGDGMVNFTLNKIFYPRVYNDTIKNTQLTFDLFTTVSLAGILRDMEGLWRPEVAVCHAVLFERFDSFLYDGSDLNLGEKNFYDVKADDYVTQTTADKINAAMENYMDTVHKKSLMDYYNDTGMTRNEIVLYFSPGLDDGLKSSLDDYLDDRNVTVENLFGGGVKYNINIPTVLCGKCVIYTRAGAYFNGSIFEADVDYAFYLPICLIFDITTGEQIQLSQLYLDGWEQVATWYDVSASFGCYSRNGIEMDMPDMDELVLVDLRWGFWQYEKSTAIFMTKDGKATYEAEIPNEYLNFN